MKRLVLTIAACVLLALPSQTMTAAPVHEIRKSASTAITQEPADEAKLVVEGPSKVKAGDLVVISVEKSTASNFKWIVIPSTKNYLVIDGGKRLVFSSGEGGEFKFIVACAYKETTDVSVHTVTVIGPKSNPVDTLSSKIAIWCEDMDADREGALALAQSFSSVALTLEGGSMTTPAEIVAATAKSNKDALGDEYEDWQVFRSALSDELERMARENNLNSTADHIRAWKEIAVGLREYAATL